MKQTFLSCSYESPEVIVVEVSVEGGYDLSVGGGTLPGGDNVNPPIDQ